MTCSTRIWAQIATRGASKAPKNAYDADFRTHFAVFRCLIGPPSGKITSDSCRAGHKLQNEYWNIKIGQELAYEMSKEW